MISSWVVLDAFDPEIHATIHVVISLPLQELFHLDIHHLVRIHMNAFDH